jgi:hypothetical protein
MLAEPGCAGADPWPRSSHLIGVTKCAPGCTRLSFENAAKRATYVSPLMRDGECATNMMRSKLIIAVVLTIALQGVLSTAKAETIIECRERPETREYWSWREIDGRRCWFKGHRSISKKLLSWGPRSSADGIEPYPTTAQMGSSDRLSGRPGQLVEVPENPEILDSSIGPFETAWRNLMADMKAQNRPKTVRPIAVGPTTNASQ